MEYRYIVEIQVYDTLINESVNEIVYDGSSARKDIDHIKRYLQGLLECIDEEITRSTMILSQRI